MKLQSIVFDASTLILLAKIDLLPIVVEYADAVLPKEVRAETLAKPESYDAQIISQMLADGRIKIAEDMAASTIRKIQEQLRLDKGEAEALTLAKEKKWIIGIDDGPGIKAAKILGVPFVTAIHILIELRDRGFITSESALAKLKSLETFGRYHAQIISNAQLRIKKGR